MGAAEGVAGKGFAVLNVVDIVMAWKKGAWEIGEAKWIFDRKKYFRYQMKKVHKLNVDDLEGKVIEENGARYIIKNGLPEVISDPDAG